MNRLQAGARSWRGKGRVLPANIGGPSCVTSRGLVVARNERMGKIRKGDVAVPFSLPRMPKVSIFDLSDEDGDQPDSKVFIDRDGDFLPVMSCDYGFRSGSMRMYETNDGRIPGNGFQLVHFAEEWNEMHHLYIMESLGGDQLWVDRFFAQHAAIIYYILLCIMYVVTPSVAYNFSELIEAHAVDTYGEFVDANEDLLRKLPPPLAAVSYYRSEDLYMFDEMQTADGKPRRPACNTLYDVFSNIRDDEGEHVKTMKACQDFSVMGELVKRKQQGRSV